MKLIVFTEPDGRLSIVRPSRRAIAKLGQAATMAAILERSVPSTATNVREVAEAAVPSERVFRGALRDDGAVIGVNMPWARQLHMDRIRAARDVELARHDIEFTIAQGRKDQAEADRVEAKRQALRDLPQTFDLSGAATPDALNALWPPGLPRP